MSDNMKDTNPKDAVGIRKVPFSTIPAEVIAEIGLAMLEGARKYGRHNYRVAGVRASVYYDAALRHLTEWWEGQDIDHASGLSHVTKAIAGLVVLRDTMIRGMMTDDRPPKTGDWMDALNTLSGEIIDRHPDSAPANMESNNLMTFDPGGIFADMVRDESARMTGAPAFIPDQDEGSGP